MSGISLRDVGEHVHGTGDFAPTAICWEGHPNQANYERRQKFHVDLAPSEYTPNLMINKRGKVLWAAYTAPPLQCKDHNLDNYNEVFGIEPSGTTVFDMDFSERYNICAILGIGAFKLSLVSVHFKEGKGAENGKKDSERPEFGARNDPASTAGTKWVSMQDLVVSPPIGAYSGEYKFVYAPFHCEVPGTTRIMDSLGVALMLLKMLEELKKTCGTPERKQIREFLDQVALLDTMLRLAGGGSVIEAADVPSSGARATTGKGGLLPVTTGGTAVSVLAGGARVSDLQGLGAPRAGPMPSVISGVDHRAPTSPVISTDSSGGPPKGGA